jgi:hypothetical protein
MGRAQGRGSPRGGGGSLARGSQERSRAIKSRARSGERGRGRLRAGEGGRERAGAAEGGRGRNKDGESRARGGRELARASGYMGMEGAKERAGNQKAGEKGTGEVAWARRHAAERPWRDAALRGWRLWRAAGLRGGPQADLRLWRPMRPPPP